MGKLNEFIVFSEDELSPGSLWYIDYILFLLYRCLCDIACIFSAEDRFGQIHGSRAIDRTAPSRPVLSLVWPLIHPWIPRIPALSQQSLLSSLYVLREVFSHAMRPITDITFSRGVYIMQLRDRLGAWGVVGNMGSRWEHGG